MPKQRRRESAKTVRFEAEPVDGSRLERRTGSLVVVQGAEADLGVHMVVSKPITIGREGDVELPLRDGGASRRHCMVERDVTMGRYVVRDLGSTNGTRLNGITITGVMPLSDGDKIFLGNTIVKFTFTDELDVEYLAKLDALVATDALTGLLTRRRFDGAFHTAVLAALADGSDLSCLVMDMDGLKAVNDQHGHEMGSFSIVECAKLLREVITNRGALCRYGGDEFVAFLPRHGREQARRVAETMRAAVNAHTFDKQGTLVKPTLSVGVSSLRDNGTSPEDLFRAADKALYASKAGGKNQVSMA
jgi:diguanylate cyclase (GGDEF)-like protein